MNILFYGGGSQSDTEWLPALRAALPGHTVDSWRSGLPARYELAACWNPPQQLFDEQPGLRVVFNLGAGVDALLALRLPPAAQIIRLEDAGMAAQMAEYVCHAAIRFYRQFDRYAAQQQQAAWQPLHARPRSEFPVGVLGLGALGRRVLDALRLFEFPVVGWSRMRHEIPGVRCYAGAEELAEFFAATRILACLLPLTPATRGLIDHTRLAQLRPGAYLINVARGALVVEDDLRVALQSGQLAGAALDVMATEPLPSAHWLWRQPGVVLTPHISAQTLRAEAIVALQAAVRALAKNETPRGLVDRTRGY